MSEETTGGRTAPPPPPTDESPGDPGPTRGFGSIVDARRSDDRMIAGVAGGVARQLNIDPVIVRIVLAVLVFVGLSGVILYLAGWLLLPDERTGRSIAARVLGLDANERSVRIGGLVVAGVLAVGGILGDGGWSGNGIWALIWIGIPAALVYWFFAVRPRDREPATREPHPTAPPPGAPTASRRWSPALLVLTVSLAAIGAAIVMVVGAPGDTPEWLLATAVALGAVGLGLLVGTVVGDAGWLVPVGLVLAVVLAVGSIVPSPGRAGDILHEPRSASEVGDVYDNGWGRLELDLRGVVDPDELLGRTIRLEHGMGEVQVDLPEELRDRTDVRVDVGAGDITVFGKTMSGTGIHLEREATDDPALTIEIEQRLGRAEVNR